ncbi:hypothetical protein K432DRAFT_377983 [Lepidopterella palustris CBS 459.81]|uniref:Uncharacterized protein n=1 Tax=Lepidopterella palustris CBS 459.81 TaxID=1314670 RepID=A0A8E2JJW5_9PEZI|nr:hypothetical protein K432DRAFT_377983 [Lepidopterella palustris CBS 459.81]
MSTPWRTSKRCPFALQLVAEGEIAWQSLAHQSLPLRGSLWAFLHFMINRASAYPTLLSHLRSNLDAKFLEIERFMSQDLRRLFADLYTTNETAAGSTQLYGADIKDGIRGVGRDLLEDSVSFNAGFHDCGRVWYRS